MKTTQHFWLACLLLVGTSKVDAQKQHNKQEASIWAPENIKIDGRAGEWGALQAHNNATGLYYTIANDDNNLYLAIRAVDPDVIRKITSAGFVFILYKGKDDKNGESITFPVYENKNRPFIQFKGKPEIKPESPMSVFRADSFMNVMNKRLNEKTKYIQTIGMKGLDTLTSVYNEDGLKIAQLFDNQMVYTCEVLIPLKYLDISIAQSAKFRYHILLPRIKSMDDMNPGVTRVRGADGIMRVTIPENSEIPKSNELALLFSTTDFWGEYTLAKKP